MTTEQRTGPAGERMMTVIEAAEYMGVTPRTVWRWISHKRLRAVRTSGSRRVHLRQTDVREAVRKAQMERYGELPIRHME